MEVKEDKERLKMDKLNYWHQIKKIIEKIEESDAILVGGAAGMSTSAGLRFFYERDEIFLKYFSEFENKYGFHNTFEGFYYPYRTSEERWAFIARSGCCVLDAPVGKAYEDLQWLLKDKNYYILTTNQDTQFEKVFPAQKISAIQGDWRYLQCGRRCHDELYDSVEPFHQMNAAIDVDLKIPTEMVPKCPHCGGELEPWVRSHVFLQGKKYKEEHQKLSDFLTKNIHKKVLFLELGVGRMTPMFIQEPFWKMTYEWENAFYITINPNDAILPEALSHKGLAVHDDIAKVLEDIKMTIETESGGKDE